MTKISENPAALIGISVVLAGVVGAVGGNINGKQKAEETAEAATNSALQARALDALDFEAKLRPVEKDAPLREVFTVDCPPGQKFLTGTFENINTKQVVRNTGVCISPSTRAVVIHKVKP